MNVHTQCTNCFKSLGVVSRMEIYSFLVNNKDSTVGQIVEYVGLTQPTVSYHLNDMKKNGILKSFKKGKEVIYSINSFCPHFREECVLAGVTFPARQK